MHTVLLHFSSDRRLSLDCGGSLPSPPEGVVCVGGSRVRGKDGPSASPTEARPPRVKRAPHPPTTHSPPYASPAATPYNMKTPGHTPGPLPCAPSRRRARSRKDAKTGRAHNGRTHKARPQAPCCCFHVCRQCAGPSLLPPPTKNTVTLQLTSPPLPFSSFFFSFVLHCRCYCGCC